MGIGFEVGGQFNPPLWPVGNEDPGSGLFGAIGILMALLYRQRHGTGQFIECPQVNAGMTLINHVVRRPDGTVLGAGRLDPLQTGVSALERLYETADGWLLLAVVTEADFDALGKALALDLRSDVRFATAQARRDNDYALSEVIAGAFASGGTEQWLGVLHAASVPAAEPAGYRNIEYMRDPANRASGRVVERVGPDGRIRRELAVLVRVSDAATAPHRLAPELGEHTVEILQWAGYTPEVIAGLSPRGTAG